VRRASLGDAFQTFHLLRGEISLERDGAVNGICLHVPFAGAFIAILPIFLVGIELNSHSRVLPSLLPGIELHGHYLAGRQRPGYGNAFGDDDGVVGPGPRGAGPVRRSPGSTRLALVEPSADGHRQAMAACQP